MPRMHSPLLYETGKGVPRNYEEAAGLYRKAADAGLPLSQASLGYMHLQGRGVPQDYSQAVELFRKSADQGVAIAQNGLGYAYFTGQGVSRNYRQAAEWFGKAAEQGLAIAQINVGYMFESGLGVNLDYPEAYKWYQLALAQGYVDHTGRIRELATRTTPRQLTESKNRMSAWLQRGTVQVQPGDLALDLSAARDWSGPEAGR